MAGVVARSKAPNKEAEEDTWVSEACANKPSFIFNSDLVSPAPETSHNISDCG
jgi:hypothetical protein